MEEKGFFVGKESSLHVVEDGQFLVITVDTSKELGPSASGKSTVIASSGGNTPITLENGKQVKLGLNLYY
jgi:predicted ABC-type transport system involved in lysophospholipase L1 biosynthesis ATPase subunit|tara:strand:+ start:1335 stop:1544 length:210 start_codon:yes stop_codon:yes gene_type:complete